MGLVSMGLLPPPKPCRIRVGEVTRLLIITHVREDHIHLYGFASEGSAIGLKF